MSYRELAWSVDAERGASILYTPAAGAAMHAASSLAGFYRKRSLTPECLLLALAQDDDLRKYWPSPRALDELLEAQILSADPPGDESGWSGPALRAMHVAWHRAEARGGMVTCGDLLSGLAGSGGVAAEAIGQVSLPYAKLDEVGGAGAAAERKPITCELGGGCIAILDDPTTPMDFVVTILREVFGCSQPRALYLMYYTHFLGKASMGPFADAALRVERARSMIAAAGFPLRIETSQDRT